VTSTVSDPGRSSPRARLRWDDARESQRETQRDETRDETRDDTRNDTRNGVWDDDQDHQDDQGSEWEEGEQYADPSVPLAATEHLPEMADDSGPIPPPRALVRARPVTRQDTALVQRTSQKLGTILPTNKQLATTGPTSQTALIPAARNAKPTAIVPAVLLRGSEPRPRSRTATIIVTVVALALLFAAVRVVIPLTAQKAAAQGFSPNGAMLALDPAGAPPSGPWDTSSGATEALGQGGGAGPGVNAPGSAGAPVGDTGPVGNYNASPGAVFVSPPPLEPWPPGDVFMTVPGHPAFNVSRPADGYYWWAFGQCTWWAQNTRRDENLSYIGDAKYWAAGAAARGYRVGVLPAVNATVMFRPGVEGAGGAGHVAHVEAVYPGGWFLISEMNFYWNGGGWGRVDYRFAHSGPGVYFIY
jgi:surface antigen